MALVTAATPRYASSENFVPMATGQVIAYIRTPEEFKVNSYAQMIESPGTIGYYVQIDRDSPSRIVTDEEFTWADGADRPKTNYNQLTFNNVSFITTRRDYPFLLGWQAIAMHEDAWKPVALHAGMVAQQAMTNRTNRVVKLVENTANWGNNTDTANNLNAGRGPWSTASGNASDPSYNAIKKSLIEAMKRISLATNSAIKLNDMRLLLSPGLAEAISCTSEIHDYLKFGPYSKSHLEGNDIFERWGLPPKLYGLEIVVEDATIVTDRPAPGYGTGTSVSSNRFFVKQDTSAVILSQKGGIDGTYGVPNFSTVQVYWYKHQMEVYTFDDPHNERLDGHVVEQFCEVLAAPESGFLLTGVL